LSGRSVLAELRCKPVAHRVMAEKESANLAAKTAAKTHGKVAEFSYFSITCKKSDIRKKIRRNICGMALDSRALTAVHY